MKKIKNVWHQEHNIYSKEYFTVEKPVYTYQNGAIYKLGKQYYLYTEYDRAFNELAGLNKDHLKAVIDRIDNETFLYQRALENLKKEC